MKIQRVLMSLITTVLFALLAPHQAQATVLGFDVAGLPSGGVMPQDYGDRVTSSTSGDFTYGTAGGFTPNVEVAYEGDPGGGGIGSNLSLWINGFSDLVNVLNNEDDGESRFEVRLTADAGFAVLLESFDLGNFGSELTIAELRIENGSGAALFTSTNFTLPVSSEPHLDFDFGTGLVASELLISIDLTGLGGSSDNVGLDNLQFGQVEVPEPSTILLAVAALLFGRQGRLRRGRSRR